MKSLTGLILAVALFNMGMGQRKFNFGFEVQSDKETLPDDWFQWGDAQLSVDSDTPFGQRCGKVTLDSDQQSFGSIAYGIPANYEGTKISLVGHMKIKDVTGGFAGLLLRIDGNGESLAFDNMQQENISGTRDWQQYQIDLPYPEGAKRIYVAGLLTGKGEAWFDNFELSIDGKDVQNLSEIVPEVAKAELDTAFNQGSGIEIAKLKSRQIDDLDLLGRVWGLLKYHHPQIGKGNYNWDYELFRFLPDYLTVKKTKQRDQMLIEWIESLGTVEKCQDCPVPDPEAFLKPDLAWMNDLSPNLRNKLTEILESDRVEDHYYLSMQAGVGNPKFKHENAYATMTYPDDGFRLLSLYRYWNMIHYFFPYRHLIDKDWNAILKEYLPLLLNAKDELAYELAMIQLIGEIKDTHANVWSGANKVDEWKGLFYPPIHVRFIEDQLVVTDYYNPEMRDEVGLLPGTVITHINGQEVDEMVRERNKYYPASNQPTRLRDISHDLLRSNSRTIDIQCQYDNGPSVSRQLRVFPKDSLNTYRWYPRDDRASYEMLDDNIGYVTLQTIKANDISSIKEDFKDTKGIIIDIRNYPSTFVPFLLGSYFVSSSAPFVKFTKGNDKIPGEFTFTETLEISNYSQTYQGKLVVMINELSQSQAEYTSMAFRAGENTTIIGSTTAGADGNVSRFNLPGGLNTMISGIGVYYPDGTETQRVGIVPDKVVEPTIAGIREGRDELMEAAIDIILSEQ